MKNFNEMYRSAILESLQNENRRLGDYLASTNNSMFTLYYAKGELISSGNNLVASQNKLNDQNSVKFAALTSVEQSQNLLATTRMVDQHMRSSVSNTAAAAANMQIATNGILKLASNISNIFILVNANDFDSNILELAKEVSECINEVAYEAEQLSMEAMETAISISKVSTTARVEKATDNNTTLGNLFKQVSDAVDTAERQVASNNTNLQFAAIKEKDAEGMYEETNSIKTSIENLCELNNLEFNFGLKAYPINKLQNSEFSIEFYLLKSPFQQKETIAYYPVKDYYLFFVKDEKKLIFSMADAENILGDSGLKNRYIALSGLMEKAVIKEETGNHKFTYTFNSNKISFNGEPDYCLQDTDGNDIETGIDYVVKLLAIYQEDYKKSLHTFEEFLSAPTAKFRLTNNLSFVKFNHPLEKSLLTNSVNVNKEEEENCQSIWFTVKENPAFIVEYRCIFLPVSKSEFIFNLSIAEQVNAANYIKIFGSGKPVNISESIGILTEWEVKITKYTTDCFGNILISGDAYIPVILSVAIVSIEELPKYKNSCTNFRQTASFVYK